MYAGEVYVAAAGGEGEEVEMLFEEEGEEDDPTIEGRAEKEFDATKGAAWGLRLKLEEKVEEEDGRGGGVHEFEFVFCCCFGGMAREYAEGWMTILLDSTSSTSGKAKREGGVVTDVEEEEEEEEVESESGAGNW